MIEDIATLRRRTIGSSEVAAVCGISRWETPFDVWARKKKLVPEKPDTAPMRAGRRLQDAILKWYADENKKSNLVVLFDTPWFHRDRDWQRASLDGWFINERLLVEVKNVGVQSASSWGPSGSDEIPQEYLAQVAWQMAVAEANEADVVALIGGQDLRVYHVARDRELEEILLAKATEFYERYMLGDEQPTVQGTTVLEYIRGKYPRAVLPLREATDNERALAESLRIARRQLAVLTGSCDQIETRLKLAIGDSEGVEGPGFRITYKQVKGKPNFSGIAKMFLDRCDKDEAAKIIEASRLAGYRRFLPRFDDDETEEA